MEPEPNNTPQIRAIIDGLNRKIDIISREADRQIDVINANKRAILREDVEKRQELDRLLVESQQQVEVILGTLKSNINKDFSRLLTQYSEGNIDKTELEEFMRDSISNIQEKSRIFNEQLGDRISTIKANVESSSTGMSCFTDLGAKLGKRGLSYAQQGLNAALTAPVSAYTAATDLTSGVCTVVKALGDFLSLFDVAGGTSNAASVHSASTASSTDSLQGLLVTIEDLADAVRGSGDAPADEVIYQMSQAANRSDASSIPSDYDSQNTIDSEQFLTQDERAERYKRQKDALQGATPDNSQGYGGRRKSKHHKKSKKSKTKKHYKKQRGGKKYRQTKKGYSKKRTLKRYKRRANK